MEMKSEALVFCASQKAMGLELQLKAVGQTPGNMCSTFNAVLLLSAPLAPPKAPEHV